MISRNELEKLAHRIAVIKGEIEVLRTDGEGYVCVERNAERMLASVKMLELEICDAVEHIDA